MAGSAARGGERVRILRKTEEFKLENEQLEQQTEQTEQTAPAAKPRRAAQQMLPLEGFGDVTPIIEALLFVSGEPLTIGQIAAALEADKKDVSMAIDRLAGEYDRGKRGLCIVRFADKVQLGTRSDYAPYVDRVFAPATRQSLSQSAIETLSIIAYRQPITRAQIEQIRGVKCEYAVSSLQSKGLIEEVGRQESLGRPILYGTTEAFLRHFSISSLDELPNREELILPQE